MKWRIYCVRKEQKYLTFQISIEKTILPAKFKPFQNYSHMIKLFTRYLKPREAAAKRSYQFRESGMRKRKKSNKNVWQEEFIHASPVLFIS